MLSGPPLYISRIAQEMEWCISNWVMEKREKKHWKGAFAYPYLPSSLYENQEQAGTIGALETAAKTRHMAA